MSAPQLTRRLILEEPQSVSDGSGGFTRVWLSVGEIWAEIRTGTGREAVVAGTAASAVIPYKITVRAAPVGSPRRPQPEQRFREGQRIFRILAVAESDPFQKFLICYAKEEAAA